MSKTESNTSGSRRELSRRSFLEVGGGALAVLATGCAADEASPAGGLPTGAPATTGGAQTSATGPAAGAPAQPISDLDAGALADAASAPISIRFDPAAVQESIGLFPRTVMAGEMKPESFIVTGHASRDEALRLRVWQPGPTEGEVLLNDEQAVISDANGFYKLYVEGLRGGEWYEYAVFQEDASGELVARSLIGRVRTALAPGSLEPVKVAMAACVGSTILPEYVDPDNPTPYGLWDALAESTRHDYDVFIHLGDQGYMDNVYSAGGSYEQYLTSWGAYHGGGYRDVYPRSGLYSTWDDHEITDNGTIDPWTTDPSERERMDNAIRAYYTIMPIDAAEPEDSLWRSFRWGDTVEFIVLDCRYERKALETGSYLSDAQFEFLLDRLRNSPCRFKCVVNSVPFSTLGLITAIPILDRLVSPNDRWEGYVTQRKALQEMVDAEGIKNLLWITGDVHMCFVGQVDPDAATLGQGMWEVCVTSGNTNPLAGALPVEQFPWASGEAHFPLLTFDPGTGEVTVEFFRNGELAHRQVLAL